MRVELFGTAYNSPIFLCPTGGEKAFNLGGELAVARAANARGTLQALSTMTSSRVEDVNKALGRPVWQQLYAQNLAGKEAYTGDAFADGTAAMASVGPWAISAYKGKVDWGVVSVPTQAGAAEDQPTFSDAKNVAVYTACANRGTAWDFLKFSTSKEQDGKLLEMTGQMPMRQNLAQEYAAYFTANPQYKTFAAKSAHVVEVPNVPASVEVWQAFRDAWSNSVIFGKADPNQALSDAASKINNLVK